jgi:processive 1,2-diacylglycerol beta-glucosyltransferase
MEAAPVLSAPAPAAVDLVFFDGGGAHRSAATSLAAALSELAPEVDVRLVNVTSDVFRYAPLLELTFEQGITLYNAALKAERMYFGDLRTAMRLGAWMSRVLRPGAVRSVRAYYRDRPPNVLVSFVPMHNRLLLDAVRMQRPAALGLVVPVDFQELLPGYWFDAGDGADYLCGTDRLAVNARAAGVPDERVHRIAGMPIHPRFRAARPADMAAARARLGLDPTRPTVLVFFGAQGSQRMVDIARALDVGKTPVNLLVVCGHHAAAERALSSWVSRSKKVVLGFTHDVPSLMRVADVFVGKPGPVSIFEAMASELPVVLWDNPAFGVLFDYNLEWVEAEGVGLRARSVDEVCSAVARVLESPTFRERTRAHAGDATGEIARAILERVGVGAVRRAAETARRPDAVPSATTASCAVATSPA